MEVKFRPVPASTLARQATPSRPSGDESQSFTEVVESLSATDHTPEQNPNSRDSKQEPPLNPALEDDSQPAERTNGENRKTIPANSATQKSGEKTEPEEKTLGTRLDLTA